MSSQTHWGSLHPGPGASWLCSAGGPCSLPAHLEGSAQLTSTAVNMDGTLFLRAPSPLAFGVCWETKAPCLGKFAGTSRVGIGELLQVYQSKLKKCSSKGVYVLKFYKYCQVAHKEVSLILLHQQLRIACLSILSR